jgi:two-component system sensor histidine kinase UhpB
MLATLYLRRQPAGVFASAASFARFFAVTTLLLPAVIGWTFSFAADLSGLRPGVFANWQVLAPAYAMGSLLITTPVLACMNWRGSITAVGSGRLATMAEAALIGIALLLLSMGLWALVPSSASLLQLLLFAPVPLMMLAAIRFGSPGAAIALVLVAIPAAWIGVYGDGLMGVETNRANAHIVQLWLLAVGFLVHVLAILSRQYESVRLLLNASHRHARSLAGRLLQGQEEERARIARELHDGVNQQIASLAIAVSSLKRRSPHPDRNGLEELHLSMIRLSEDVRRISHNLHPSLLEHVGLGAALDSMVRMKAEQWDGRIHYEWEPGAPRPPAGTTVCLYRIAQEALCNAIRHAGARHIRIQFESLERECLLVVEDDGRGFNPERVYGAGGLGLLSMHERAALQGGCMRIVSTPEAGTQVRVTVPMETPAWP